MTNSADSDETFSISSAQFSAIINQSPVGMYAVDSNLRLRRINPKARPIFGPIENPVGRDLREVLYTLWPHDAADEIIERFRTTLETGEPFSSRNPSEVPDRNRQHEYYDWELHRIPLPGGQYEVVCYITDVSAHVHAQKALREGEQRLRAMFNQAAVGMAIADLHGRFEQLNQKFAEILGYTRAELQNLTFEQLTYSDDLAKTRLAVRQLLAGETAEYVLEKRYVRKDGSMVWSLTTVTLLKDAAGRPQQFIGVIEDITLRKQAEEAVVARERELSLIYRSVSEVIFYLRAEGDGRFRFISVNQAFLGATGLEEKQVLGKHVEEVIPEPSFSLVLTKYEEAIREKKTVRWEETTDYPTGRKVGSVAVTPLFDEEGKCINLIGTVHDVTERKQVEEALRDETRVLELLNTTGTAIAAKLDLQGLVQTVTDAATQLSGAKFGAFFYNVIDAQGEAFLLYTLSGAPREAFEKFGLPRNTPIFHPTFKGEGVVRSADITKDPRYGTMAPHHGMPKGHLPVCSYLAVPVISRSGETIGGLFFGHPEPNVFSERSERLIVGVAAQAAVALDNARLYDAAQRQIAERLKAEQKLRESETRLRLSLEATALGTWEYNPQNHAILLDTRCRELFGLPAETAVGYEELLAVVHPADRAKTARILQDTLSSTGESGYDIEYRIGLGSTREERWIRSTGKAFFDQDCQATRLIGTVLDITEMVKARESTAERRQELEQLVTERTASLREAIAQMEEFSYSVSHDLRSPLRAIQGYAEVLLEDYRGQLDARGLDYLQRISNAGTRMDQLTQDVLTYSRLGRVAMRLVPVNLEQLVDETVQQYIPVQAHEGGVTVDRPLPTVLAHGPSLVQALSNLLANAVKFIPKGTPPRVRVRAERHEAEVRLWIEDNGIGIPPEYQPKIWGMFERLNPRDQYEGTGIGLAIVRKAVERMGGKVGVESDGQNGSKFWIQLSAAPE